MTADSNMTMYMDDLRGRDGGLLERGQERELAKRCEAGVLASWMLDGHDPAKARTRMGSAFTMEDLVCEIVGRIGEGEDSPAVETLALDASDPEDRERLEHIRESGDAARMDMINHNLRLVVSMATSSSDSGETIDRIQNGGLGLCHGVLKYDWRTGNKISTYIHHWILQAMGREGCNTGRTIRIPAHMDARIRQVRAARGMGEDDGSLPLVLSMSEDRVKEAVSCERLLNIASLDRPLSDCPDSATLADIIGDDGIERMDDGIDREMLRRRIRDAAGPVLSEGCGRITALLHGFGGPRMTVEELCKETGMGRKALRRADRQGMRSLAAVLAPLAAESGEYTLEEVSIGCE